MDQYQVSSTWSTEYHEGPNQKKKFPHSQNPNQAISAKHIDTFNVSVRSSYRVLPTNF